MSNKTFRQKALLKLIADERYGTQEELAAALIAAGFPVTQATLSRDLRDLGLAKRRTAEGELAYASGAGSGGGWPALQRMSASFVMDVKRSGNITVIKTVPGYAQGVASAVDGINDDGILGSVAGDDTIFVVTADEERGAYFEERIISAMKG
jgi:transcriptional regulator of arginine metabolism